MPLTSSYDANGQEPPRNEVADRHLLQSEKKARSTTVGSSSSPPPENNDGRPSKEDAGVGGPKRLREPPSPRRAQPSPPPPPRILSTARCTSTPQDSSDSAADDVAARRARTRSQGQGRTGSRSGRKTIVVSGRANAEKGRRANAARAKASTEAKAVRGGRAPDGDDNTKRRARATALHDTQPSTANLVPTVSSPAEKALETRSTSTPTVTSDGANSSNGSARPHRAARPSDPLTKDTAGKKKSAKVVVTRTSGSLRTKEQDSSVKVAHKGIRGGSISSSNRSTPLSSPPNTTLHAAGGASGRPSTASPNSALTSARLTAPPSARPSAGVEAFLLGVQNCLNRQELLFQQLQTRLTQIESKPASALLSSSTLSLASATSSRRNSRSGLPQRSTESREALAGPEAREEGSDTERIGPSMRYSVGTPPESSPTGSPDAASLTKSRSTATATADPLRISVPSPSLSSSPSSTQHTSYATAAAVGAVRKGDGKEEERKRGGGCPLGASPPGLMPSFVVPPAVLSSPLTPSCSVVVVHPTLERVSLAAATTTTNTAYPLATTTSSSPPAHGLAAPQQQQVATPATSLTASPTYLRLETVTVTTSTSATPSTISDSNVVGGTSSSASGSPPSPAQLRSTQNRYALTTTTTTTAAPSPSSVVMKTPLPQSPVAPLTLVSAASSTSSQQPLSSHHYHHHQQQHYSQRATAEEVGVMEKPAVPARRSSGVQWEGGTSGGGGVVLEGGQRTPRGLPQTSFETPPSSSSNPPPLPTLPGLRHQPFSTTAAAMAESHALWSVSPRSNTAGAVGNGSLRLATVSTAMSLLTSVDSVTLSPLSRPMSVFGGSPMTHSVMSGGSPGQPSQHSAVHLPAQIQHPPSQQPLHQLAMSNSSLNCSATSGNAAGLLSPPGALGRSAYGGSPRKRSSLVVDKVPPSASMSTGSGAATTPVSGSSPYSPVLFQFVSPPSTSAISSSESPFQFDGGAHRPPQLQPSVLSPSSPNLQQKSSAAAGAAAGSTMTTTTAGGPLPVPPRLSRMSGDALSPLSPTSSSSPSSTPTTTSSRRASASLPRHHSSLRPASESLSHCNSSFVSADSLDEEGRAGGGGGNNSTTQAAPHPSWGPHSTAPQLPSFPGGEGEVADTTHASNASNFVVVSNRSLVSVSHNASDPHNSAAAASAVGTPLAGGPATRRQLALSTSPSVERSSREDGELVEREERVDDVPAGGGSSGSVERFSRRASAPASTDATSRELTVDGAEEDEEGDDDEDRNENMATSSKVPLNPFALPPPPSSLSELHAHQQRRRRSSAPVPTMRRPPMAPARPGSSSADPTPLDADNNHNGDAAAAAAAAAGVHSDNAPSSTSATADDATAQVERWLSFERQHEQLHLPPCWRDSEVVVIDHVEEEDRERDAETAAQLRLLEEELMRTWQGTPSGSERDGSQTHDESEEEEENEGKAERIRRRHHHHGRRHSYPGNGGYAIGRDDLQRGSGDEDLRRRDGVAVQGSDANDDLEWDDDDDVDDDDTVISDASRGGGGSGSYQERLAQYGRMMLQQRRRSLHAPRYRGLSAYSGGTGPTSADAGATGPPRSTSPGSRTGGSNSNSASTSRRPAQRRAEKSERGSSDRGVVADTAADAPQVRERSPRTTAEEEEGRRDAAQPVEDTADSHRAFRRGNSAPAVVSDGGHTDWQSLQARFNELVHIQQRVRGGGDESSGTAALGAAAGPADKATLEGGNFQRANSGGASGRRRRSRSYTAHRSSPSPEAMTPETRAAAEEESSTALTSSSSNAAAGVVANMGRRQTLAYQETALHLETLHEEGNSHKAEKPTGQADTNEPPQQQQQQQQRQHEQQQQPSPPSATLSSLLSEGDAPARAAVVPPLRLKQRPSASSSSLSPAVASVTAPVTHKAPAEDDRPDGLAENDDTSPANWNDEEAEEEEAQRWAQGGGYAVGALPTWSTGAGQEGEEENDDDRRSPSAPSSQPVLSPQPPQSQQQPQQLSDVHHATDISVAATPERHHRAGVAAVHKDPPAFLANSHSALIVEASHATVRASLTTRLSLRGDDDVNDNDASSALLSPPAAAVVETPAGKTDAAAVVAAAAAVSDEDGDETEEDAEDVNTDTPTEGDEAAMKTCTPTTMRPGRTPRLRFTHTPRGTARPNALGKVRRVVILHSEPAIRGSSSSGNNNTHSSSSSASLAHATAVGEDAPTVADTTAKGTKKKTKTSATVATAFTTGAAAGGAAKRSDGADQNDVPSAKMSRRASVEEGRKTQTAKKKKKLASRGSSHAALPTPAGHSTKPMHANVDEGAAPVAVERRPSISVTSVKTDPQPAPASHILSASQLADVAQDGGEAVEPLPLHSSPHSLPTAHPTEDEDQHQHQPTAPTSDTIITTSTAAVAAAGTPQPLASTAVPSPKAEKKARKTPNAPTTTNATAPRRKSVSTEVDTRGGPAGVSREKDREKPDEEDGVPAGMTKPVTTAATTTSDNVSPATASTSDSRALLRRLAERKDRLRAMEERLRLSSGHFTNVHAALAVHAASGSGDDTFANTDSAATTPLRSALKSASHSEGRHLSATSAAVAVTPEKASRHMTEADDASAEHSVVLETSPLQVAPNLDAAVPPSTTTTDAVVAVTAAKSSDPRHVSVVAPETTGPSVTFAVGHPNSAAHGGATTAAPGASHAAAAAAATTSKPGKAAGTAGTRRRRVNLGVRPGTSSGVSAASKPGGATHKRSAVTSAALTPSTGSAGGVANTSAAASGAASAATGAPANGAPSFKRGDSLKTHLRSTSPTAVGAAAPPSSTTNTSAASAVVQERRRHTMGDVPYSSLADRRIHATRTPLNHRPSLN